MRALVTEDEVIKRYKGMGLEVSRESDLPGEIYSPHSHEKTYLYTLKGSIKIKLGDQDWQEVKPGQEIIINEGQTHEAIVGPGGWEYIYAH